MAGSWYGVSSVGAIIYKSKYENGGDFPDHLVRLTLRAYRKRYGQEKFDLVLYVPPTESGNLVKNFAARISNILKIPVSHKLIKTRTTRKQKIFQNAKGGIPVDIHGNIIGQSYEVTSTQKQPQVREPDESKAKEKILQVPGSRWV